MDSRRVMAVWWRGYLKDAKLPGEQVGRAQGTPYGPRSSMSIYSTNLSKLSNECIDVVRHFDA